MNWCAWGDAWSRISGTLCVAISFAVDWTTTTTLTVVPLADCRMSAHRLLAVCLEIDVKESKKNHWIGMPVAWLLLRQGVKGSQTWGEEVEVSKLTQKRGANVFRYLIARFTRFTQMRQFFIQHSLELKRVKRGGEDEKMTLKPFLFRSWNERVHHHRRWVGL